MANKPIALYLSEDELVPLDITGLTRTKIFSIYLKSKGFLDYGKISVIEN